MRWIAVLLLASLAGCVAEEAPSDAAAGDLAWQRIAYPGSDVVVDGTAYGFAGIIHNQGSSPAAVVLQPFGMDQVALGPVTDSWEATLTGPLDAGSVSVAVGVGERVLVLGAATHAAAGMVGLDARVFVGVDGVEAAPLRWAWNVTTASGTDVGAGDHVQTQTVGFWTNGTSFYTNIPALNADPDFPAGYPRADFVGDPLPVYVYGADRTEQPPASRDTCHFTTIPGYNALLRTQAEGSTGVRFLAPEEAYTRPGAQDHPLYGDALVFMNTIVAHDGATGPLDTLPDPQGACFDEQNTIDYAMGLAPS